MIERPFLHFLLHIFLTDNLEYNFFLNFNENPILILIFIALLVIKEIFLARGTKKKLERFVLLLTLFLLGLAIYLFIYFVNIFFFLGHSFGIFDHT